MNCNWLPSLVCFIKFFIRSVYGSKVRYARAKGNDGSLRKLSGLEIGLLFELLWSWEQMGYVLLHCIICTHVLCVLKRQLRFFLGSS